VAKEYESVIGAKQLRYATNLMATAHAVETNALATAKSFSTNSVAQAALIQLETSQFARAALFTNQLPAYAAAPAIYKQRIYFQTFGDYTAHNRKYLMLTTNVHNVVIYNLEESIADDITKLKVPTDNKP
jgi:hypothetical protein